MSDTASRVESTLLVNGTQKDHSFSKGGSANNDPTAKISITLSLTANDAVKMQGWNEAGSAAPTLCFFSGYMIGRP